MKAYSWKRGAAAGVVVAAVILAAVFWPRQADNANIDGTTRTLARRPKPSAEELYQTALHHKELGDSPAKDYRIVVDCCRQIGT